MKTTQENSLFKLIYYLAKEVTQELENFDTSDPHKFIADRLKIITGILKDLSKESPEKELYSSMHELFNKFIKSTPVVDTKKYFNKLDEFLGGVMSKFGERLQAMASETAESLYGLLEAMQKFSCRMIGKRRIS